MKVQLRATMQQFGVFGQVIDISEDDFARLGDTVSKKIDQEIIPEGFLEVKESKPEESNTPKDQDAPPVNDKKQKKGGIFKTK